MSSPFKFSRIIDLTHTINDHLPPWPGDKKSFEAMPNATFDRDGFFTRSFWSLEHYGTHLDAPIHFARGGATVDEIPAEKLFGPAVLFDVRADGERDADYALPADRVAAWEKKHGAIPAGAIVILRTGRAADWDDAVKYRGLDAAGGMHFPGFSAGAVKVFLARGVVGLAADAMSVDVGASKSYEVHYLALGAGIWQVENLSDLSEIPEAGATIIAAPIKLEGGSGGPCRVFALIP